MTLYRDYTLFKEVEIPKNELIVSRTDLHGKITYANDVFAKISGYKPEELIGKSHSIIRHPDMPKSPFKEMWETIVKGESWSGYVKNRTKEGRFYWVFAEVSCVIKDEKIVEYKSMRYFVEKEKRYEMQDLYDLLRINEGGDDRVVIYGTKEEIEAKLK